MAEETTKPGISKAVPAGVAGVGLGAIVMALIGQPAVVQRLMDWFLAVFILGGIGVLAATFIPVFLARMDRHTDAIADLGANIKSTLSRDDDVRMSVRALSKQLEDFRDELRDRLMKEPRRES
jgi:hypothetical protein